MFWRAKFQAYYRYRPSLIFVCTSALACKVLEGPGALHTHSVSESLAREVNTAPGAGLMKRILKLPFFYSSDLQDHLWMIFQDASVKRHLYKISLVRPDNGLINTQLHNHTHVHVQAWRRSPSIWRICHRGRQKRSETGAKCVTASMMGDQMREIEWGGENCVAGEKAS